jgi:TonB-linked outer membrane protein, SusC/RagA family
MTGKPSLKCLTAFLLLFLAHSYLFAQEKIVTGKVKDPQGNPLPGVNINVWGTRQSVTADVTGSFSIPVPSDNSTLVFSFVGFLQQEVKVGEQTDLQVTMAYDNADLDQVVVVGYGAQRRRDLTGSVYSVKPGTITQTPTFNALEALQGRVPGLDITRSSGNAGAGVNILVRGQRTFSVARQAQQPLYIIDGFQGGNIADLNPNDIESVEVLRDASATAIYGWMGANGVIIVTTKKGKDRPRVSYSGYYGVNGYTAYPKGRIGEDYVKLRREAYRTANGNYPANDEVLFSDANELAAFQAGQWVDWIDLINQNGTQQSHSASIQSGGDKTKIFFSTGYYKEEGMLRNNDMTRYNARLNYDQRISNVFKAGLLTQVVYSNTNGRFDPLSDAATTAPLGKPYDEFGRIILYPSTVGKVNPLADEEPGVYKNNTIRANITANGYIEITPVNGLTFRSNLGTTLRFSRLGIYQDSLSLQRRKAGQPNYASQETGFSRFYNWDNYLTFTRKFDDHAITLTAISSYTRSDDDGFSANGIRQLLASQQFYNLGGTEQASRNLSSGYTRWSTMSYAGRINYALKGKYLLTASLRTDGASRLAPGNKWDYFPSAAIGWNIHQEGFMANALFVNNLKLRASYGIAGNASIAPYQTQSLVQSTNPGAWGQNFGDVAVPGFWFTGVVGNPTLTWEKTATKNLGLDFAFFKSRLYGTVEVYESHTTDILYNRGLPQSSGVATVWQNIGETKNRGVELAISSVNAATSDFRWTSTLTYTSHREEITKLIDGKDIIATSGPERNSLLLGHPIESFYTWKRLGIWQTSEAAKAGELKFGGTPFAPGDIKLLDVNGDSIIDADNDRMFVGSTVPKWYAGFQNTFTYKGFELSVYLFARWGQTIDAQFVGRYNPNGLGNGPANFDYWTPENPSNDFPRPRNATISQINGYQTLNFVDGSYLKIKTLTLAYSLPQQTCRRLYADKIRIHVTGNNIFTYAKNKWLKDYDPERGGSESSPLTRQVVVGLNVDF